jgi:hypothetical protein
LDFYQAHIYPHGDGHNGTWGSNSPFFGPGFPKASLGLDKPLVLGEFPMVSVCMCMRAYCSLTDMRCRI